MLSYASSALCYVTFWNFWHITCISTANRCKVINAQTGPAFIGPPCTMHWCAGYHI